jgi:hypothetical protein
MEISMYLVLAGFYDKMVNQYVRMGQILSHAYPGEYGN